MKEYTLAQTIDKLGKNPNLKFKYVGANYKTDKGFVVVLDEYGRLIDEAGELILSNFSIGSKFRLVNEPVSVKEAFKAFEQGKAIYCILLDKKYEYSSEISGLLESKTRHGFMGISVEEILYGKWFIEEAGEDD